MPRKGQRGEERRGEGGGWELETWTNQMTRASCRLQGEGGIESRALQLAGRRERLARRGELSEAWLAGYA